MKQNSGNHGFTRRELVVAILMTSLVVLIWNGRGGGSRILRTDKAIASAKSAKAIFNWLQAYSNDNDGKFPEAKDFSNEGFRQLFVRGYLDDEQGFAISNDPWLNHAPGGDKKPDNEIGTAPDFAQALQPGECSWAYVTGLTIASPPTLPLMGNAFSDTIGVYSNDRKKRGGVFAGEKAVWVSVGGSAKVYDLGSTLQVEEKKDGRRDNIYSADWGTIPANVKNPARLNPQGTAGSP